MKAAIYTRYSTDKQRKTSTEDQRRNCEVFAVRERMVIAQCFSDEEISGTVRARPGYSAMLEAAEAGEFEVLLVDDLSRLARDATEQSLTLKRLKFLSIRVVGVSEGYDSDAPGEKIHAAVKGMLNELIVDNIRFQTKRGLEGRVLKGLSAGGRAYGYRSVPVIEKGQSAGYALVIEEAEARVIRRICTLFAEGNSPLKIAARLNEEGVPSPRGGTWARSAIHGDPKKGSGILNNVLYIGRYVWDRAHWVTNPMTGKRTRKPNDESSWLIVDVPELRIVPDELWQRVKARQARIADTSERKARESGPKARTGAGPKYLFSSLLTCAECGSNYVIVDQSRYGCARHKDRGPAACANGLKVERQVVEQGILDVLKARLLTPEALEAFRQSLTTQAEQYLDEARHREQTRQDKLSEVRRSIERLVDSIANGIDAALVCDKLNQLGKEQAALEQAHRQTTDCAPTAARVIEAALARYDEMIARLEDVLMTRVPQARELLRTLFGGAIVLAPMENGTLETKMAGIAAGLFPILALTPGLVSGSEINVVAGTGFEPVTFGL
ncbi:recombinase family protein [Uliginosibacterium paludis]|uniref:Recombinase family protein n=1 Tax=Uliginosibacterium paludis TaxID=1615952 RepID=A0ABV2CUD7_9RHOO